MRDLLASELADGLVERKLQLSMHALDVSRYLYGARQPTGVDAPTQSEIRCVGFSARFNE